MRDHLCMNETERKCSIVYTFDDGYKGVLGNALPSMKRYGFIATVYVCTEYVGKAMTGTTRIDQKEFTLTTMNFRYWPKKAGKLVLMA